MKKICTKCGGSGMIVESEGKAIECQCAVLRRLAFSMPIHIRKSRVEPSHANNPITDSINKSLYIFSSWSDMKSLIKVTMYKNPNLFIRVSSDREIRDVGVGSTSRASRGDNSEEAIFNNLQDLMNPPKLMVVRLNELAYKNKAAPGFLEEALSYRLDRDMPTWLISDKDNPFGQGSHAWSQSVWDLICSVFDRVDVPRVAKSSSDFQLPVVQNIKYVDIEANPVNKPEKKKNHEIENSFILPDTPSDDSDSLAAKFGGGIQKKKKKNNF